MKRALFFIPLFLSSLLYCGEQPTFTVKDPKINENFRQIFLTMDQHVHDGVDSSKLKDVIPNSGSTYSLGDALNHWKNIYVDTYFGISIGVGSALNSFSDNQNVVAITTINVVSNDIRRDVSGSSITLSLSDRVNNTLNSYTSFESTAEGKIQSFILFKSTAEQGIESWNLFKSTGQNKIDSWTLSQSTISNRLTGLELFETTAILKIDSWILSQSTISSKLDNIILFVSTASQKIDSWNLSQSTIAVRLDNLESEVDTIVSILGGLGVGSIWEYGIDGNLIPKSYNVLGTCWESDFDNNINPSVSSLIDTIWDIDADNNLEPKL